MLDMLSPFTTAIKDYHPHRESPHTWIVVLETMKHSAAHVYTVCIESLGGNKNAHEILKQWILKFISTLK